METALQETERLKDAVAAEAAVCRAGLAWVPAGKTAAAAGQRLVFVQQQVEAAQAIFLAVVAEIASRDDRLGADLRHLGPERVTPTEVKGDSVLIRRVLAAAKAVRERLAELAEARAASSNAHAESARMWRDVLLARDELRERAPAVFELMRRLFEPEPGRNAVAPPTNAAAVEVGLRERLAALGEKP